MTVYDLVGAPFPKDHPLFASDDRLQKKMAQLESFIEMHHDVDEITAYLKTASKIKEPIIHLDGVDVLSLQILDGLAVAAIVLYAKLFNASQGRTTLNKMDIFDDLSDHDHFIDVRDKFLAHQEWIANRHQVFFFPSSGSSQLKLNPYGQTVRVPIWPNLDWTKFDICLNQVGSFIKDKIEPLCRSIVDSLTSDQLSFLNSASKEELLSKHWVEQPHLRKDPFSSR